jgi:MFS family permease
MPAPETPGRGPNQDWRVLLAIFFVTSMVEGMGVSQIYAFVPAYLSGMGVPEPERLRFVGIFGSLIFVVGAPLVPLWGVWADKYSRKAVIARSAVVEAVVLAGVALSREPWQLALSMMLIGLQLGNTGVMLAEIRDVAPRRVLGRSIGIFGASGPVGFAVGPVVGGIVVDGLGFGIPAIFAVSSLLSIGTALLVWFGSREVRPEVVPTGSVVTLAFGAIRGVLAEPAVRRIFAIFGMAFLANQMTRPYVPVLVEGVVGPDAGLASAIALVTGTAALAGVLMSPIGGAIGDRIGFTPVLVGALVGGGVALLAMPLAGSVPALAVAALATQIPPERRSATLNLVYLPLYAAGIVGPATGAIVVSVTGLAGAFVAGAAVFLLGAGAVGLMRRR